MKLAAVTFSVPGLKVCQVVKEGIPDLDIFLHDSLSGYAEVTPFSRVLDLTPQLFPVYDGLIFVAPCGVVVRSLAGCPKSKYKDPAVVVADVGGRHVVSLLSGHEGGANDLAVRVANLIDGEPVISTTTEAVKDLIVGIGCRKGKAEADILGAIEKVLADNSLALERVRYLATASVKRNEEGLLAAAKQLDIPLRIIADDTIRNCHQQFTSSDFVTAQVDLPAVAEPAALCAGRRTSLIVRKQALSGITIAIAQENCTSLA